MQHLQNRMPSDLICVCAGTPVQNNMRELFGLMNLLDNEKYADEDEFFGMFGGDKEAITLPQVQALQVSSPPPPQTSPPNCSQEEALFNLGLLLKH